MKTKSSSSSPSVPSGEGGGIPKHIVHSFQIHQEDTTSNTNESESELNIQYYERNFPVGSMFNFNLQMSKLKLKTVRMFNEDLDLSKPYQEQQINPSSFHIGEGAQLILKSLVLPPSYTNNAVPMSLWISTNVNPDYSCVSYNISSTDPIHTLRDLTIVGPATVKLALVKIGDAGDGARLEHVTIFGNVKVCKEKERVIVIQANQTFMDLEHEVQAEEEEEEHVDDNGDDELKAKTNSNTNTNTKAVKRKSDKQEAAVMDQHTPVKESKVTKKAKLKASSKIASESVTEKETATEKETPNSKTKKRKLSEDETTKQVENENEAKKAETSSATLTLKKLTKKQRKKQAKEKEEQLSQAIAKEQGYDKQSNDKNKSDQANNGRARSLTKPRMIKGGINIQDILHGTGSTIRNGRKVSINYTGTFDNPESNRIFDKNTSKANPLTFRMGTGEVIRGLDRGLEGMRVGGERIIIVPPSMGYGEKGTSKGSGSGGKKIPGGAILCFTVQLRSIGKWKWVS